MIIFGKFIRRWWCSLVIIGVIIVMLFGGYYHYPRFWSSDDEERRIRAYLQSEFHEYLQMQLHFVQRLKRDVRSCFDDTINISLQQPLVTSQCAMVGFDAQRSIVIHPNLDYIGRYPGSFTSIRGDCVDEARRQLTFFDEMFNVCVWNGILPGMPRPYYVRFVQRDGILIGYYLDIETRLQQGARDKEVYRQRMWNVLSREVFHGYVIASDASIIGNRVNILQAMERYYACQRVATQFIEEGRCFREPMFHWVIVLFHARKN